VPDVGGSGIRGQTPDQRDYVDAESLRSTLKVLFVHGLARSKPTSN
jgi:hypothetical protein